MKPLRWYGRRLAWVPSETHATVEYLVDLDDDLYPFGKCDCPDFLHRIENPTEATGAAERYRCKHIDRARRELGID